MKDIQDQSDVKLLVDSFYEKVRENRVLGHIFEEVAQVDWQHHLPKMYAFWASILLGERSYDGNPMLKHIELSKTYPLGDMEFEEWLRIFYQTVDELFEGERSEDAKLRAANIARLMLYKIGRHGKSPQPLI